MVDIIQPLLPKEGALDAKAPVFEGGGEKPDPIIERTRCDPTSRSQ